MNYYGYQLGGSRYRDFIVYDGKGTGKDLFSVCGSTTSVLVNAAFVVKSESKGIELSHSLYEKTDKKLVNLFSWTDSKGEKMGWIGYDSDKSFDYIIKNAVGNIVLSPSGVVNVLGELLVNGVDIAKTYVTVSVFNGEMKKKGGCCYG